MKFLWLATAATLAASAPPAGAADEPLAGAAERKICKREKKINSRFTAQVCHTKAEWDAIAEANRRAYAEQRDRPTFNPPGGD